MGFGSFKKGTKKLKKAVAKLEKQRQEELQSIASASVAEYEAALLRRKEEKALKKERKKKSKATIETSKVVFLSKKSSVKPWFLSASARAASADTIVPSSVTAEEKNVATATTTTTTTITKEYIPVTMDLSRFSKDLLVLILKMLPLESLRALACVDKFFCEFILRSESGELVWRSLCLGMYNVTTCMLESWKCTFDLASSWTWSKELISESVELSNYNLTARATCSGVGVAKANVIAEAEFDSDFQYWSVRIDKLTSDGITIGVASVREEISTTWLGFNSYATLWHQQVRVPYGKTFRAGDIVSVLLDYGKRRIAFFVNHEFVNVASRETGLLQRKLHLAAALAYEGDQLTLLPPLQWPPQKAAISAKNDLKQT